MEAEDYSAGCSFSLMCQEDGADLGDGFTSDDDGGEMFFMHNAANENEEEEYMEHLVSKETSFCSSPESSAPSIAGSEDWLQCTRRATVKWILETRGHFGFCHRTAYVAVAYFDRFSLRRCVDRSVMPWATRLLAMACVSLAAKMDEYRAPALSELCFCGAGGYEFSSVSIRRMELLVLSTLDWRMGAVTPFDYLPCLSSRLLRPANGGAGAGALVKAAAALIFSAAQVASVLDYRPSTVAAAAVLAATHGTLTKEALGSKMIHLSPSCLPEKEEVYACYTRMLGDPSPPASKNKNGKRSAAIVLTDSTYDSSFDAASFSVAPAMNNNKRVRLELPLADIHR
ncbi:cyclin-D5-1 [Brachypodium distachyon]|uniref:Cyclin-like domain-containing protein n=1 Tax=Brachypodium distachyon TaxID=15368 RepID=A0A0Q3GUY2_BRADI|nr:cyclin-D5-1 [Brachypodium distachyon]KQK14165.1 hypothetical protein BRADI_1g14606v3 [Brachypodium distachyon]|eukprot:XP_014757766.1 cyclin-D5-1 [Brachypodium distachyon]